MGVYSYGLVLHDNMVLTDVQSIDISEKYHSADNRAGVIQKREIPELSLPQLFIYIAFFFMIDRKELPRTVFVLVYFQKTQFKSSINMREILRPFRVLENLTKLAP